MSTDHFVFIEYHGVQHFEFNSFFHKSYVEFLKRQLADVAKTNLVKALGEELVVLTYKDLENNTLELRLVEYLERYSVVS